MIKAVIFDLFETLITEWSGKKLMKADCAALLGVDARAYSAAMEDFALSMYTGGETYIGAVASSCRACGAEPSGAVLDEILKRRIETKSACFAVQYSERDAVLASLRARGIRLGILSNCSSEEVTVLRASYFYPYFDADALSFEVGLKKPKPAIYALMCSRLDAAPEECVFVGDGGSRELYGAREAGMTAVRAAWFLRDNAAAQPFPLAERFADVEKFIR